MRDARALRQTLERELLRVPQLYAWLRRKLRLSDPDRAVFCGLGLRGGTVVEAGANQGHYTLLFARLVGVTGSVLAFEPNPQARACLEARIRESEIGGRVGLFAEALSDRSGHAVLTWPVADTGQSSLLAQTAGSWSGAQVTAASVRTLRLDDLVAGWQWPKVRLVKIDVEGAELQVLRGSETLLRTHRPILHIEVCQEWQRAFGYGPRELQRELERLGFDRYCWIGDGGRLLPGVIESPPSVSANALCLSSSQHPHVRLPIP